MPFNVNILNTTNNYRTGIATCGIYFEKGEVTSTSQVITEVGGTGYRDFGGQSLPRLVQWTPFGANHSDGSYRFARASFHVELDTNRERRSTFTIHPVGVNPYYIAFPYNTNSNQSIFNQVFFDLNIDGEVRTIRGIDLSLVGTAGVNDCVRRYRGFFRPFSRQSIWVELVVDVPNKSQTDSLGANWTSDPATNANFWFRWGVSYLSRNTGVLNLDSPLAIEQSTFRFTSSMVTLTITGCPSHMRFQEHLYGSTNLSANSTRWNLHDPTAGFNPSGSANKSEFVRGQACKSYRGVLFLGGDTSSAQADRQPTSSSPEISCIAEGWNKHMPPVFADIPLQDNVARPSDPDYRADWIGRINTLLNQAYGQIRAKPHESSPYGSNPTVSGAGEQGAFGCAYHHNPLWYTMKAAYPKEIPFLVKSVEVNCFRPQWHYEQDGTHLIYSNYPTMWIWNSYIFERIGATSPDTGGTIARVISSPQQVCASPYNEWQSYDREHASVQGNAVTAILTADYHALEFCKMWAENYGAQLFGHTGNVSIDSWSADRASARTMQSLIPLYYATGSFAALVGIAKRSWLAYLIVNSARQWGAARIDRLDTVEKLATNITFNGTVTYNTRDPNIGGNAGSLYNNISGGNENPYFTGWQLSFVAVALYQVSKMFADLFPNGAYLTNFNTGSTINTTSLVYSEPGGNRVEISSSIMLNLARDLSATVINYCAQYMGYPGSEYDWQYVTLTVVGRPGLNARTAERIAECFPVGGVVVGQTSGTTGTIVLADRADYGATGGELNGTNTPINMAFWLKNCTGPGFIKVYNTGGIYINEEIICTTTGYSTNIYRNNGYSGRCLDQWFGATAYCFDRYASSRNLPGTGENYRKPLTRTQLEETDSFRIWNIYVLAGPRWISLSKDYGVWITAPAAICVEGVRAGYYTTGDAVNYPVNGLLTKAKQILTDRIAQSAIERGAWDQFTIPFLALMQNWKDEGLVDLSPNILQARAIQPPATLTVIFAPITNISLDSRELTANGEVLPFIVFAEQTDDIIIKPLPVYDGRKENVQQITLDRDYDVFPATENTSSAVLPQFDVTAIITPNLIINKLIHLAMRTPIVSLPIIESSVPVLGQDSLGVQNEPGSTSYETFEGNVENGGEYYLP